MGGGVWYIGCRLWFEVEGISIMLECLVGNPMKLLNIVSAIRLRTGKFLLVDQSSRHVWHLLAEAEIN